MSRRQWPPTISVPGVAFVRAGRDGGDSHGDGTRGGSSEGGDFDDEHLGDVDVEVENAGARVGAGDEGVPRPAGDDLDAAGVDRDPWATAVDGDGDGLGWCGDGDGRGDLGESPGVDAGVGDLSRARAPPAGGHGLGGLGDQGFEPLDALCVRLAGEFGADATFGDLEELRFGAVRVHAFLAQATSFPAWDGKGSNGVVRGDGSPGDGLVECDLFVGGRVLVEPIDPGELVGDRSGRDVGQGLEVLGHLERLGHGGHGGLLGRGAVPGAGDDGRDVRVGDERIAGRAFALDTGGRGRTSRNRLILRGDGDGSPAVPCCTRARLDRGQRTCDDSAEEGHRGRDGRQSQRLHGR